MRLFIRNMAMLMLGLSLTACNKKLTTEELPANIADGGIYYTQVVMHHEKDVFPTTNYQVGAAIPVNTQIKLLEINKKAIAIELSDSAEKLTVKNIPKHTGEDIFQTFNKLFSKQKLNLAQFNALETAQIKAGKVAIGMRKNAVTAAIGYPPTTRTANLEADSWIYWQNRYNTFAVNFKNGKVAEIVD